MKLIARYLLLELLILAIILMMTKGDLFFHLSDPIPLTTELIAKKSNLTYDQMYMIDQPMRYRMDIESVDGSKTATLLWPKSPFGSFLVLTASDNPNINNQSYFSGKLVRCVYKCLPSDMLIEMFSFVESLEKKYPKLKGKYKQLPSIVIDTFDRPKGWEGYFESTKYYWSFFALCLSLGGLLLLRSILKSSR